MRIVMYHPAYPPVRCGVGEYTRALALALIDAGHDVTVVTGRGVTARSDGPPQVLPLMRDWGVKDFLRTIPHVVRPRPDIVVSSFPAIHHGRYVRMLYLLPGMAKLALGFPRTVFIDHEFLRTRTRERNALALALRAADRVIAVSEHEREAIVTRYPDVAGRITVVPNASMIPTVPDDAQAEADLRAQLAPADTPLLAFFGTLYADAKGFEEVLEALALLDGARLAVTGSLDVDTVPYHAIVAAQIDRLGLTDRVRWLGHIDDEQAGRFLRVADAVLLPFRLGADGGYTSLLAAIVNGAAVITTRGPQNAAWLRDGETALLVEPSDPEALAGAVRRLLDEPQTAARIRAGARALSFTWDALAAAVTAPTRSRIPRLMPPRAERGGQPLAPALARWAAGAVRRRVSRSRRARVQIGRRGVFMDVDLDTLPGIHVYRHGFRDDVADALDLLLRPGDVVIDGGANLGGFSLVASSIVGPQGAVHAIEAAPGTAAELRRSVALNPRHTIHVYEAALAQAPGELEFTAFEAGHGGASLAPQPGGTVVRVAATTLDALTAPLARVDLVKLDVEGAELRALQGGRRMLAEHRPLLVLEFEPAHLGRLGDSAADVESLLTEAGYTAFEIAVDGGATRFVPLPSPWRRPVGEPNILLVPAERRGRIDGLR